MLNPLVAKLDIAADSDSEGRGFESLRADQVLIWNFTIKALSLSIKSIIGVSIFKILYNIISFLQRATKSHKRVERESQDK